MRNDVKLKTISVSSYLYYPLTLTNRGLRAASFFAAASIELAAVSNSFSATTVGSSGSTQSDPENRKYLI